MGPQASCMPPAAMLGPAEPHQRRLAVLVRQLHAHPCSALGSPQPLPAAVHAARDAQQGPVVVVGGMVLDVQVQARLVRCACPWFTLHLRSTPRAHASTDPGPLHARAATYAAACRPRADNHLRACHRPQAQPSSSDVQRGTSVPGLVRQVPGGVARNIVEGISRALASTGAPPPRFVSVVGDDAAGAMLLSALRSLRRAGGSGCSPCTRASGFCGSIVAWQ